MTSKRIALIIDKSKAYVAFKRNQVLEEWAVDIRDTVSINSLSSAGLATIFGPAPAGILEIDDDEELVDKLNKEFLDQDFEELSKKFENGLIVTATVARTKTKKLEANFTKLGASLIIPSTDKKDRTLADKLLDELNLNRGAREFLSSYVGEDYTSLIPLISSIGALPKAAQADITEEELYIRLPQVKGAVPPWNMIDFVTAGDCNAAIDLARRLQPHSGILLWFSVFKNKLVNMYKTAEILKFNPRMSDGEVCEILGIKTNGFYYVKRSAKATPIAKLQKAVEITLDTEGRIKGSSTAPSAAQVEIMLVELCEIFKRSR